MFYTHAPHNNQKGITVLELLIATSVFCLLTSLAVPSFSHLLKQKQQDKTVEAFIHTMNFARQTAVDYTNDVIICSSSNEQSCDEDWNQPLMVFLDVNKNKKLDEDERLLRKLEAPTDRQIVNWRSAQPYIKFSAQGYAMSGRLYYCDKSDPERYRAQLILFNSGRTRVTPEAELRSGCGES